MSQIETIMLIILGFAVALLLALILGKLLWGQAVGLGKRRSRREDPVTIAALQAEKDKLRAESAMLSRKLELRLDDLKTRLAEQTAEVSRNRNRVDHLVGEIKDRDAEIKQRDEEIESLKNQMVPLEEELATRTRNAQKLKEQMREKDDELVQKTALIDNLHEQLKSALATNSIVGQTDVSATERLQGRIADLTNLSKQIEQQRIQLTQQHTALKSLTDSKPDKATQEKTVGKPKSNQDLYIEQLDNTGTKLEQQLAQAERETDDLQKELARLDEDWNEKLKQLEEVKQGKNATNPDTAKTASPKTGKKKSKKAGKLKQKPAATEAENQTEKAARDEAEPSNVVSLANRIRSLQSDIKGQKT